MVEEGRVVGILSEKDILKVLGVKKTTGLLSVVAECLKRSECLLSEVLEKRVKEVMTAPPIVVKASDPVKRVFELFLEKGINRLPVVDEEERLVGIIARGDLFSHPLFREASL